MKAEKDEEKFKVCMLIDDYIIENQREKKKGYTNQSDQNGLGELTKTCFPVNFPVGSDKCVKCKPEKGYDRNTVI
jgi:hypothetical protein